MKLFLCTKVTIRASLHFIAAARLAWLLGTFASFGVVTAQSSIVLGNLNAIYDGLPKTVTAMQQGVVTTVAGTGTQSPGQPFFQSPVGVAMDGTGALYVVDAGTGSAIWKITAGGAVVFAGQPDVMGYADGPGTAAKFFDPHGVAVDGAGNVYVADSGNNLIRKITSDGTVSTLAGSYGSYGSIDGTGTSARFWGPQGLAVDAAGNVYVADGNACIRKISPGGVVTTIAGSPGNFGHVDGVGSAVRFSYFLGIALDSAGNIYVTDGGIYIRKITPGGSVTTLAGAAGPYNAGGYADGTGSAALFRNVYGLAVDAAGDVFVGDAVNAVIRKITPTGVVTTVAGAAGSTGTADGTGSAARFYSPTGLVINDDGVLHVTDTQNHLIRKVTGVTGTVSVTYDGSPTAPTSAGSYAVVATSTDGNFQDTATGTLVIAKAPQTTLNVSSPVSGNFGSAYMASSTGGSGGGGLTWALGTGSTAPGAAINSSTGAVTSTGAGTVVIKVTKAADANYEAATSSDLTVSFGKAIAAVTLGSLSTTYDTLGHAATATTAPASLAVIFTYDGSIAVPVAGGSYLVVGTIDDINYSGSASGTLVISPASQTVSFAGLADQILPVSPISLSASATSGLPVAFSVVSGPATVSGNVLSLTGSGLVTLRAMQPGNSNYSAAPFVDRAFAAVATGALVPLGFDALGYLARYPDVAAFVGNNPIAAWLYYRDFGIYQGEVFDDYFRPEEYLALYPELAALFGNDLSSALVHWLTIGRIEGKLGRIPLEFKAQGYFDRNPDVAVAVGNDPILAWGHYWLYGIYEGRAYDDELRVFEYLAINADLTAAFVDDWRTAALHWMRYGRTEGRLGRLPLIFNATEYLVRNPDVAATWGTNPTTVFLHFWLYGINESRTFDDLFRVDEYLVLNPDLLAVFGTDRRGAFKHWVRYGQTEGRLGRNP